MDFFPPPLLLNSPLSKGLVAWNMGWPLSAKWIIMISATLFHSPFDLLTWVPYHLFSQPSPRYDQDPNGNLTGVCCNVLRIRHTIFFISWSSPYNVIDHGHEDDPSLKLLRFTLKFCHHLLNLFENSQCSESWKFSRLEFHLFYINLIQFKLELVLDWCLPNIAPSQKRRWFWISWFEKLHHTAVMILST